MSLNVVLSYTIEPHCIKTEEGRRSRDRMVVGFTTTCVISAYQY
jgi:hypothetical protein